MNNVSPKTHIYRLGIVLVIGLVAFMVIRSYAIPASWNYDVWYRSASLEDIAQLPLRHGGNESCKECHEDVSLTEAVSVQSSIGNEFGDEFDDEFGAPNSPGGSENSDVETEFEHKTLSCESCHGALADHADADDKIDDALVVDRANWQCMICHRELLSRPAKVAQFTEDIEDHEDMREQTLCMKCHNPHDPIEEAVASNGEVDFGDEL